MGYFIVSRNPHDNKPLVATDEHGEIAEFDTEQAATNAAKEIMMCKWGFEIVEVPAQCSRTP
jgi:hypothetical protein